MKIKQNKGIAGIDMVIAIIAVTIFSTLIISMMYNNVVENVKLKKETLAMIYITEIFENVGIENYTNLTVGDYTDIGANDYAEEIEALIPEEVISDYKVDLIITDELDNVTENEDILKKVQITLTYDVNDKTYTSSMQRMKIKE